MPVARTVPDTGELPGGHLRDEGAHRDWGTVSACLEGAGVLRAPGPADLGELSLGREADRGPQRKQRCAALVSRF